MRLLGQHEVVELLMLPDAQAFHKRPALSVVPDGWFPSPDLESLPSHESAALIDSVLQYMADHVLPTRYDTYLDGLALSCQDRGLPKVSLA